MRPKRDKSEQAIADAEEIWAKGDDHTAQVIDALLDYRLAAQQIRAERRAKAIQSLTQKTEARGCTPGEARAAREKVVELRTKASRSSSFRARR